MEIQGIDLGKTLSSCYLLYGEETWTKNQIVDYFKKETVGQDDLMNYTVFEGKECDVSHIIDLGETMPFFAQKKMIVIRDSGLFKTGKKEETQKLAKWLETLPEYMVIVFDEREMDKRNILYKFIHKNYKALEVDVLDEGRLMATLQNVCKEKGIVMTQGVLSYFVSHMPKQMQHMLVELEKLATYCQGKQVTKEDIEEVCVFALEQRVFELLKKTAEKRTSDALAIYHKLIESKESPIGILVLLARQYRMLLQVKYLVKAHTPTKQIAQKVGLPFYVAKELEMQSQAFSFKQLQGIIELCLTSDVMIKTGKMEAVKCIEMLIIQCIYSL